MVVRTNSAETFFLTYHDSYNSKDPVSSSLWLSFLRLWGPACLEISCGEVRLLLPAGLNSQEMQFSSCLLLWESLWEPAVADVFERVALEGFEVATSSSQVWVHWFRLQRKFLKEFTRHRKMCWVPFSKTFSWEIVHWGFFRNWSL